MPLHNSRHHIPPAVLETPHGRTGRRLPYNAHRETPGKHVRAHRHRAPLYTSHRHGRDHFMDVGT
eukprot:jgi/Mesvir1/13437/Mv25627-RA.1